MSRTLYLSLCELLFSSFFVQSLSVGNGKTVESVSFQPLVFQSNHVIMTRKDKRTFGLPLSAPSPMMSASLHLQTHPVEPLRTGQLRPQFPAE